MSFDVRKYWVVAGPDNQFLGTDVGGHLIWVQTLAQARHKLSRDDAWDLKNQYLLSSNLAPDMLVVKPIAITYSLVEETS